MLLALLIYAYAHGVRSSRQIQQRCVTDVAFRVLCAQDTPDHTTIWRVLDHEPWLERIGEYDAFVGRSATRAELRALRAAAEQRAKQVADAESIVENP